MVGDERLEQKFEVFLDTNLSKRLNMLEISHRKLLHKTATH
jgi:hypothetical protein